MTSKEAIKDILFNGTPEDKKALFVFDESDSQDIIYKKFQYFSRYFYSRYYKSKPSQEHEKLIRYYIASYMGDKNFLVKGFRGFAKTTYMHLLLVFFIACDYRKNARRYIKILSRDIKNSKQIVVDTYNMLLEVIPIMGDMFLKEGKKKREETKDSFTVVGGRKLIAGSVGQDQRGDKQDASRPDFIWFDDIEDRTSIASPTITQKVIDKVEEALDGMSPDGTYVCTANYISEYGSVAHIASKNTVEELVVPIATNIEYGSEVIDDKVVNTIISCESIWEDRFPVEKIKSIYKDAMYWYSEYLCDPTREDDKFFNLDRIDEALKNTCDPIRTEAGLKVWKDFYQGHRFGIGADVALGVGRDSSTIAVWNYTTGELVGTYRNNTIAPDLFAHEIARAGNKYGGCLVAPERNNEMGGTCVEALKHIYSNIYQDRQMNVHSAEPRKLLGFNTTTRSKYNAFINFRTAWEQGEITIYDEEVLREMKSYSTNDLETMKDQLPTRHFDLLMAVVIGWEVMRYAPTSKDPVREWNKRIAREKKRNTFKGL